MHLLKALTTRAPRDACGIRLRIPSSSSSRPLTALACVAALSGALTPTAFAQSAGTAALQAQLASLQRQLQAAQSSSGSTNGTPEGARPLTIEERIEELTQQLRVLARQIEIDKEQAAERAKTTPLPAASRTGFSLQSADGQFRLRLRGYLHSDGRFFLDDSDARGVDTFVLRRVRPIVEATMYGIFDFRVMPDFGGGTTVLQDAYMEARFRPEVKIRAGKFKPPVGLERLASATEMTFIERALPTALVPNRDLGIMLHGDIAGGNVNYAVGVFNGVPDGGSADADTQDGKDVAARVFVQPFRTRRDSVLQNLGFGMAGTYGEQRATAAAATGLPSFRTSGQTSFFAYRGDDPVLGPVLANGRHTRVSVQGYYYYGSFGLLGEHVLSSQEVRRSTNETTLDNTSWQVAGSWVLTGETPSYRGVTPRSPFDIKAGTWGAVELTGRYSTLSADRGTFPAFANPANAARRADGWTAGANWILNTGVKLQVNLERMTFEMAGTAERKPETALLTRMQFAF